MSQKQKLEQVLELLLSESTDEASEILHQIIVEKARVIYESIVENEEVDFDDTDELDEISEADEVGGEPNKDFTDEIASDTEEINADEHNDGEAGAEADVDDVEEFEMSDDGDMSTEDKVEDLEAQLAELRAEFDALMGEELQEPQHADLASMFGGEDDVESVGDDFEDVGVDTDVDLDHDEVADESVMYEKVKKKKLEKAPEKKDLKKSKKVDEETQFLHKTGDTGQRGTAKLVGTGKNTPLGAEDTKAPFTSAPSKKDFGGKPVKMGSGTGGEYGKFNAGTGTKDTPSDNVNVKPKTSGIKADATPKYTGGKAAGEGFNKSPFTKKPA